MPDAPEPDRRLWYALVAHVRRHCRGPKGAVVTLREIAKANGSPVWHPDTEAAAVRLARETGTACGVDAKAGRATYLPLPKPVDLPRRVVIDHDAGTVTDAKVVGKLADGEVTVSGATVATSGSGPSPGSAGGPRRSASCGMGPSSRRPFGCD